MTSTDPRQAATDIQPTVGRVVWYREYDGADERAAIIAQVHSARCVNLAVFDNIGGCRPETSVVLRQPDDDPPKVGPYCEWMPYQQKKAFGSESGEAAAGTKQV